MTNEELLNNWDAGKPIKTVSMGGFSEGYEMVIHILGMELLREFEADPFDYEANGSNKDLWEEYRNGKEKVIQDSINKLGPSGAQVGAAFDIANVYARNGYEKGLSMASEDRIISISKDSQIG